MDNFIVSARKYRPDTFNTVVGQSSITQTLKNAIVNNHLAQAYLFCGPRGVGKTTCARLLAKIINCFQMTEEVEACNVCESCTAFNAGRSYNIHELDAASNNSVEDIRSLIEQVRIPPQVGKYNIYIIDEVHMLSTSAFNAFLKTLEEPPAHAIFILATTEKHKIIPTILSRCQIFDFNRIQTKDTVQYLKDIAEKEGIAYEEEAFTIIAQKADGGMRDALSIFDQIVAFSGKHIRYKDVIENLNILDYEHYFNLTEVFLGNNFSEALAVYDQIVQQGFDARNFINGLSSHFRDLLVCKEKAILQLLEVGESIKERYQLQTANCEPWFLLEGLNLIAKADTEYNQSRNKRLHVELLLINLCHLANKKKNLIDNDALESEASDYLPDTAKDKEKPAATNDSSTGALKNEDHESKEPQPVASQQKASTSLLPPPPPPKATLSIKNALQGNAGNKKKPDPVEKEATPVVYEAADTEAVSPSTLPNAEAAENSTEESRTVLSEESVEEGWATFLNQIEQGKPRLHAVLSMRTPTLSGKNTLVCSVVNQAQKDHLFRTKSDMLVRLVEIFQYPTLDIEFLVDETVLAQAKNKVLTNEEKFNQLAGKNPSLIQFRKDFSLDFE